ncbi:alkaline phosphatase family protein [Brumimicrobium glaciale]|uniref:Alkaline phosphatase family protein n=1 Tax=Brumimicrobium glaciale TaxID=200475 RepID=A0A4Q4KMK9_9FLAO|nr:alkaline phosphatase family protein [Brumimicrobium glaciale]RYM34631.1 alkaline phosphatase family protein [Brumimicrobium glaciale]
MNSNALFLTKNIQLLKRLGIILLMMTIARLVFYFVNSDAFTDVKLYDFFVGIWMDSIAIGMYTIPFYILSLLPLPYYHQKWYQIVLKTIFHITNSIMIALNLIDVEYFKFTAKRSTADLFSMVSTGNDMNQLLVTFMVDFWWLILLFITLIFISNWLYNKTINYEKKKRNLYVDILNFIIVFAAIFIVGRGGLAYRPADMLTASQLTNPDKTALVANTPLSIIKTIGKSSLIEQNFFEEGSSKIYSPIRKGTTKHQLRKDVNVMVIILESFGNEWIGKKTGGEFTPFLDSLLDQSLYFDNAFANGKKSIEAVPAIFAGIPSMLDNPYISSSYGTNSITALPQLLKEKGYSSAFYHGATNGSMKFDVFAAHLGFDHYFGRKEYGNEDHTDETWGVLDEYFMPWTAQSITKELKEPFLAGLFSLSSHHPYFVPEEYRAKLPSGKHPMAKSIAYADMSLRLFFQEAKKQPWYENTVFVICADHTPAGTSVRYNRRIGMYQIPIAFYDPQGQIQPEVNSQLFNQIDIMPSILDLTGYSKDTYTFGNSYLSNDNQVPFSINYIANSHMLFKGDYMLNFVLDKPTGLYNYKSDTLMKFDSLSYYPEVKKEMTQQLKGIIQRYNHDLIHNTMKLK